MSRIIFIICFFAYGGYYTGLALIFSFNLGTISRFYSQPLRMALAILMIYIIIKNRYNLVTHKLSRYIFLFIVFWVFYILKVLYTVNEYSIASLSRIWYEYIFYAITYVLIPFIAFCSLDIRKYWLNIISGFIFSGFSLGIVSIYLYGKYLIQGVGRINAISYQTGEAVLSPLALSYTGVLTILLCLYQLVIYKKNTKFQTIYLISTIILSLILFLFGASRGSVVVLFLTLPLFVLLSPLKQKVKLTVASFILAPVLIWLVGVSGSGLFDRLGNTSEDRGGGRTTLWENAFNHFLDYPIFGGKIEIGQIYPHNFMIEVLMSTGLFGAMLIFPVIIKGFTLAFSNVIKNKKYMFSLLILLVGFVHYSFSGGLYTTILLFIPIGIIFSQNNYDSIDKL